METSDDYNLVVLKCIPTLISEGENEEMVKVTKKRR